MKRNFKKTKKNKIISLVLFFIAFLSIFIQGDVTAFVLISLLATPLFFAKNNYINL